MKIVFNIESSTMNARTFTDTECTVDSRLIGRIQLQESCCTRFFSRFTPGARPRSRPPCQRAERLPMIVNSSRGKKNFARSTKTVQLHFVAAFATKLVRIIRTISYDPRCFSTSSVYLQMFADASSFLNVFKILSITFFIGKNFVFFILNIGIVCYFLIIGYPVMSSYRRIQKRQRNSSRNQLPAQEFKIISHRSNIHFESPNFFCDLQCNLVLRRASIITFFYIDQLQSADLLFIRINNSRETVKYNS